MVFDVIRDHKSDVVGLQEALKFQIDEILEAVSGLGMVGVGREDGKTKGSIRRYYTIVIVLRWTKRGPFGFRIRRTCPALLPGEMTVRGFARGRGSLRRSPAKPSTSSTFTWITSRSLPEKEAPSF